MEQNPFINYPGAIATSISDLIRGNSTAFIYGWNLFSLLFILFLTVTVYLKFIPRTGTETQKNKFLKSNVLFITVTLIGVFLLRLPNLILKEQNPDESQWIANAATFLNHGVLWKNVNGYTGGPLLFVPLSIMYYFGEGLNYASIRLFGLLFCILPSLLFVYLVFKKLFSSAIASLLLLPFILFSAFAINHDLIAYNSEHIPMLITAISLFLFFSLQKKYSLLKLFAAGFLLGLFPFAKLQAVPIAFAIAVCIFIETILFQNESSKQKFTSILFFIAGGLIPSILISIYLIHYGVTVNFRNAYILQNFSYAQNGLASHVLGWKKFLLVFIMTFRTIELLWLFIILGILILVSSYFIFKNKTRIENSAKRNLIYLFAVTVCSYLSVCLPGNDFVHYEILLIVPLVVFTGMLFGTAFPFLIETFSSRKIFYAVILLTVVVPVTLMLKQGNKGIKFIQNGGNYELSAEAKEIKKYSSPNEKLAIWGWSNKYYVETEMTQGTPGVNSFYEATNALRNNNSSLENYVSDLEINMPTVFLDASQLHFIGFNNQTGLSHENFPVLNNFINQHYQLVTEINLIKIYVLNERLIKLGLLQYTRF